MKDDQHRFLSLLGQLLLRLTAEQAGWVLNCQPHDIPALIHARLLKPLGNPAANGIKFFATADLLENAKDRTWLVKMTATINQHWQHQNARKKRDALASARLIASNVMEVTTGNVSSFAPNFFNSASMLGRTAPVRDGGRQANDDGQPWDWKSPWTARTTSRQAVPGLSICQTKHWKVRRRE